MMIPFANNELVIVGQFMAKSGVEEAGIVSQCGELKH